MEFENNFAVTAPIDEVWDTLLDVERVAPCVPGAQVLERSGEDAYKVGIKVKVGPVSMQYKGDVEIVERDPEDHRAVMSAKAKETRGQGTANARVEMRLAQEGKRTEGTIATDVQLSGKAAAMGQGVIQDVSTRLVDTFADNLAKMLAAPAAEAEAEPAPAGDGNGAAPAEAPAAAPPTPPEESELEVLPIVGSVLRERLRDPRVVAFLAVVLGFILLRRRGNR
jgi:carbon monoxide dehydrogenase subunit G